MNIWLKIIVGVSLVIVGLIVLILAFFCYSHFRGKYLQSKHKADFIKIFGDWKRSKPMLEIGAAYGWPFFIITFINKEDLEFASKSKLTDDFKSAIRKYYSSNFETDTAIYFRYLNQKE